MSTANLLRGEGNAALQSNKISEAINVYSQALLLFGLSNKERAMLHANRCQAYLKLLESMAKLSPDERLEYIMKALEDATMAAKLRPSWWKAHCRVAQVHKYNKNFKKAINSLEYALCLRPDLESVRNAIDECKHDISREGNTEHLDPKVLRSLGESVKHVAQTRGYGPHDPNGHKVKKVIDRIAECSIIFENSETPELQETIVYGHVIRAHKYLNGDGVPLDMQKAASLFKKAADAGNTEGVYNLGLMYLYGFGVSRNVPEAVQLFMKAATTTYTGKVSDDGIAVGKYFVGKCYHEGIHYAQSYPKAVEWYTLASREGCGDASSSLGTLYYQGLGVDRSMCRAIQYQKLGVEQGTNSALFTLFWLFLELGDADEAELWFHRSLTTEFTPTIMHKDLFQKKLSALRKVLEDKKPNINPGSNQIPRRKLMKGFKKKNTTEMEALVENLSNANGNATYAAVNTDSSGFIQFEDFETEIRERASAGCKYAQKLWSAMKHFSHAKVSLYTIETLHPNVNQEEIHRLQKSMIEEFANCLKLTEIVVSLNEFETKKLENVIRIALKNGDEESKRSARVCHTYFLLDSLTECREFARLSLRLYPEGPYFYQMLSSVLGFLKEYSAGAQVAQEGLDLFPDDYELLFNKSVLLSLRFDNLTLSDFFLAVQNEEAMNILTDRIKKDFKLCIDAYEKFLEKAPEDHRKVPEIFYKIAREYTYMNNFEKANEYYQKGVQAEKCLLSCFLPYDSVSKRGVHSTLNFHAKREQPDCEFDPRSLHEDLEEIEENRKLQSTNPKRIFVTRKHRNIIRSMVNLRKIESKKYVLMTRTNSSSRGLNTQRAPKIRSTKLEEITFDQMDPTIDKVYEGTVINLTIMEDLDYNHFTAIHSVVKDDNGDFQLIAVYNVNHNDPRVRKGLSFGSRIRLQNPYLRLPEKDRGITLRVDDPKSIIYISRGDTKSLCRFCWKENSQFRCSKCSRAKYCSKECQVQDWKLLNHSLVCVRSLAP